MARQLYVYVDVDDTLVRSAGTKRVPIPAVVEHVRQLHAKGALLYCWSSGGADYARSAAEELKIAPCFVAFLPKPQIIIDDQLMAAWPQFLHVYPSSCRSFEDYLITLAGPP
jgi:predicted HAD superfamily phosphohydrolase YqeG